MPDQVALNFRTALRLAPRMASVTKTRLDENELNDQFVEWLRAILTTGCFIKSPFNDQLSNARKRSAAGMKSSYHSMANAADTTEFDETDEGSGCFSDAAGSAAACYDAATSEVVKKAMGSVFNDELNRDLAQLSIIEDPTLLIRQRLWQSEIPAFLDEELFEFKSYFEQVRELRFWLRWYQGFLKGDPICWQRQYEIALIDEVVWQGGATAVSSAIFEIETRFDLLDEIVRLEKTVGDISVYKEIGHNSRGPNIEVDALGYIFQIVGSVAKLKAEAEKEKPSRTLLKSILDQLLSSLKVLATWSVQKLDTALDEFTKEVGKHGWKVVLGVTAARNEQVQSIWEAGVKWLEALN